MSQEARQPNVNTAWYRTQVETWLRDYRQLAGQDDVMRASIDTGDGRWADVLTHLVEQSSGDPAALQSAISRQTADVGTAFRLPDEKDERAWPLGALPLLIDEAQWRDIEASMIQRACLLEAIVADIYGPQTLISDGALPATAVSGSPDFWRQMVGVLPPGSHFLQFLAVDIGRGPKGEWRVLADHCRTPAGAGYALENRIAMSRATHELHSKLGVRRLAPFFSSFRDGLAARCDRSSPRIALLTPGRYNQSYAEQAHLARYLGLLLVEGADLAVNDDKLYVRTIEGPKRIDAVWSRLDAKFLDPLAFDVSSHIGTPGLFDALLAKQIVFANAPGVGVLESPAMAAFLPQLAHRLLNTDLLMPNTATWWCGQAAERDHVFANIDRMVIEPAFIGRSPMGMPRGESVMAAELSPRQRDDLLADVSARPGDYVGREVVHLSTMPSLEGQRLQPRPFMLRVFLARDSKGEWTVMPGGLVRQSDGSDVRATVMGQGTSSSDLWVFGNTPVRPVTLLEPAQSVRVRRKAGVLPSRAADSLYWLGRYLERGEITTRVIRALQAGTVSGDGSVDHNQAKSLMCQLLASWGAITAAELHEPLDMSRLCMTALVEPSQPASVESLLQLARGIAMGIRERLSPDFWRLANEPPHQHSERRQNSPLERTSQLLDRFAAFNGLASENMSRGPGWHFHDMGRRIERAASLCRLLRQFAAREATADQLSALLDLYDNQITYRARYLGTLAVDLVRDLLALDAQNPRSLAFQMEAVRDHLRTLPSLRDDGMPELPVRIADEIAARITTLDAGSLNEHELLAIETQIMRLSDAIGERFFLQSSERDFAKPATQLA